MPDNSYWRDYSERLVFEMFRVPASEYPAFCKAVETDFSLTPNYESFGAGLDAVFMDYHQGDQAVELACDNWSGFTVVAKNPGSESLVRVIAAWLQRSMPIQEDV